MIAHPEINTTRVMHGFFRWNSSFYLTHHKKGNRRLLRNCHDRRREEPGPFVSLHTPKKGPISAALYQRQARQDFVVTNSRKASCTVWMEHRCTGKPVAPDREFAASDIGRDIVYPNALYACCHLGFGRSDQKQMV